MELLTQHLEESARHWRWFIVIGILLVLGGIWAVNSTTAATLTVVTVLGLILLTVGLLQALFSIRVSHWSGFFAILLSGLLSMVVGYLCITRPAMSAISLTLLLAAYLLVSGLFRVLTSVLHRFPHWGWAFASGIASIVLGALVWAEWPISGLWALGLFVGIDLIFGGISCAAMGWGLRRFSRDFTPGLTV